MKEEKESKDTKESGLNARVLSAVFLLLAIAAVLYFVWGGAQSPAQAGNTVMDFVSTGYAQEMDYSLTPKAKSDGTGFFICTSDGVRRYDNNGGTRWDFPLNLSVPVMVADGGYIAVSEPKGTALYLFGPDGLAYSLDFDSEILSFNINSSGYAAVMTGNNTSYTTNIYSAKGALLTYLIHEDANNYPIAMDISNDGRILAISFLDTSRLSMSAYISLYYINKEEAADYSDGLFAATGKLEDQIIPKLYFAGNKNLIYIGDSQIGCYETGTGNYLAQLWSQDLHNQIAQVEILNDSLFAVALGKSLVGKTGEPEGTVKLYGMDGSEAASYAHNGPVTYLSHGLDSLIVGGGATGKKYAALNDKGRVLWEYTATVDNPEIILLDKTDKIALASPNGIEILERKKTAAGGPFGEEGEAASEDSVLPQEPSLNSSESLTNTGPPEGGGEDDSLGEGGPGAEPTPPADDMTDETGSQKEAGDTGDAD